MTTPKPSPIVRDVLSMLLLLTILPISVSTADLRLATYNLQGYRLFSTNSWPAKSPIARIAVRDTLASLDADIVALQEMGSASDLDALATALEAHTAPYPYRAIGRAPHAPIQLAFLSRLPFTEPPTWTQPDYLLHGLRTRVSRGFLEINVSASSHTFRVINVHLKSALKSRIGDPQEIRRREIERLYHHIATDQQPPPGSHLILAGDFNAHLDAPALRILQSSDRLLFLDAGMGHHDPTSQWTHDYRAGATRSRIDFLWIHPNLLPYRQRPAQSWPHPNWAVASDHRAVSMDLRIP